jgi:hypothetical protein
MVESTIDLEKTDYHEYHIKPDFDENLKGKRIFFIDVYPLLFFFSSHPKKYVGKSMMFWNIFQKN